LLFLCLKITLAANPAFRGFIPYLANGVSEGVKSMQEVIIGLVVPIATALIAYFAASKKATIEMLQIKETNRLEIEKVKLQTEHEIAKIQATQAAESKLHEEKTKTDITAKQFENPAIQEMMGKMLGSVMEKEMLKHFSGE